MKKKQPTRKQAVLAYAKTLVFGVLDENKTRSKYASYKNELYKQWKDDGDIKRIVEDFMDQDLGELMRWNYSYEFNLLDNMVNKEGPFKADVKYLRTWAKHAFHKALIAIVQSNTGSTDREAQMMATRIYMDNYKKFNKHMSKEFVTLISDHFYRSNIK